MCIRDSENRVGHRTWKCLFMGGNPNFLSVISASHNELVFIPLAVKIVSPPRSKIQKCRRGARRQAPAGFFWKLSCDDFSRSSSLNQVHPCRLETTIVSVSSLCTQNIAVDISRWMPRAALKLPERKDVRSLKVFGFALAVNPVASGQRLVSNSWCPGEFTLSSIVALGP